MNSVEISELNLNLIQLYRSQRRVADVATPALRKYASLAHSATKTLMPAFSRAHELRNYLEPCLGSPNNLIRPAVSTHRPGPTFNCVRNDAFPFANLIRPTANEPVEHRFVSKNFTPRNLITKFTINNTLLEQIQSSAKD